MKKLLRRLGRHRTTILAAGGAAALGVVAMRRRAAAAGAAPAPRAAPMTVVPFQAFPPGYASISPRQPAPVATVPPPTKSANPLLGSLPYRGTWALPAGGDPSVRRWMATTPNRGLGG